MAEKLEAHHENRVYYFKVISKKPDEVIIDMYTTIYTLVKNEGKWANGTGNKMNLVQGLVEAVIKAVEL